MSFLILGMQKQVNQRQMSHLQYEETCNAEHLESLTDEMAELKNSGVDEDDPYMLELQAEDDAYSERNESIESQVKLLEADIKALDEGEKDGIKNSAPSFG